MIGHAGRSHPAHRCPLRGGHQTLRRNAATGHEKSAGRDAERSDRPQNQATPRQADPPTDYETQHRRFQHRDHRPEHQGLFRHRDVITAAFREFSAKNLEKEKKPSIRKELEQAKQQSKAQHRQREKVKTKDRGVEL